MKLILLGTKGGPQLSLDRSSPAQVVLVNNRPILVDCGEGTSYQLLRAGIDIAQLEKILFTHHHSDHNAGYGGLLLSAWASGMRQELRSYGPPPLAAMTEAFLQMNAFDIELRVRDEGRPHLRQFLAPTELTTGGLVYQDEELTITSTLVNHPPIEHAFGYRIDADGASVVFSGDTAPCAGLIELAHGADVLVHEVINESLIEERIRPRSPNADWQEMRRHLVESHTSVTDVGKIAAAAGVGTLVLSHFVPADLDIAVESWLEPIRASFKGTIIVGQDLMEIEIG